MMRLKERRKSSETFVLPSIHQAPYSNTVNTSSPQFSRARPISTSSVSTLSSTLSSFASDRLKEGRKKVQLTFQELQSLHHKLSPNKPHSIYISNSSISDISNISKYSNISKPKKKVSKKESEEMDRENINDDEQSLIHDSDLEVMKPAKSKLQQRRRRMSALHDLSSMRINKKFDLFDPKKVTVVNQQPCTKNGCSGRVSLDSLEDLLQQTNRMAQQMKKARKNRMSNPIARQSLKKNEFDNRTSREERLTYPPIQKKSKKLSPYRQQRLSLSNKITNVVPKPSVLPLSLQREQHTKKVRRKSIKKDNEEDGRRNLDKRTARLRYSKHFKAQIETMNKNERHRNGMMQNSPKEVNGVSIYVRKRPLFDYEKGRNDFDVIKVKERQGEVIVQNCVMHPDMRRMFVKPIRYPCSIAFDHQRSNEDVFDTIAYPLLKVALEGGIATLLMYGQTGSGKSYTIASIESNISSSLFQMDTSALKISVQFVELAGKRCVDLLGSHEEIKLAENKNGSVTLVNAKKKYVSTVDDLNSCVTEGKKRRATEATEMNGVSSRSHAILILEIIDTQKKEKRGNFTLIDLAGSERRHDSLYHSSDRQKETSEINASLWALKECTRARAIGQKKTRTQKNNTYIPYRSNNLTRILKESFEREDAKLSVIATVAPNATNTEHTMETLKTVANIVGSENLIKEFSPIEVVPLSIKKNIVQHPKSWKNEYLVSWLRKKKLIDLVCIPEGMDGKSIMRIPLTQMKILLCNGNIDIATKLFQALRTESDKVSKLQLRERQNQKNMSRN